MFLFLFACTQPSTEDTSVSTDAISSTYEFSNAQGESTVSYNGQILRHVLLHDLIDTIDTVDSALQTTVFVPDQVTQALYFYLDGVAELGDGVEHHIDQDLPITQTHYTDIDTGKNLLEKLAGNDSVTDHKDWTREFVGWQGVNSPTELVQLWIETIDRQATDWSTIQSTVPHVYVTPEGWHLQELLEKFILGSVAFSQGTDDYLHDDIEDKGLLSSNIPTDDVYSPLQHAWDEGFGYFGASRNYHAWTDAEIADSRYMDVDGNGEYDLLREVNWGHSQNAGKRDNGAINSDITSLVWEGFVGGRTLLQNTSGRELTSEEYTQLQEYRDKAVLGWEMAISATIIHYINACVQDAYTENPSLVDVAQHWSEMKGFALSLQFNPNSQISDANFVQLHAYMGQAPVIGTDTSKEEYIERLLMAKDILASNYPFAPENIGDVYGKNGW